jgi:hypothetical protein
MAEMDDSQLVSFLQSHEASAIGYFDSEIASEQAQAIDYYYGRMDDLPAPDGSSSVTDRTVAVMVDNGLAAVLKPFVSADEVVAFEPRGPEDVAQAEQATEYVNYVINCDNAGFILFHNWFKDALLTKIGVVKCWWEDSSRQEPQQQIVDAVGLEQARDAETYQGETDNGDGTFTVEHVVTIPDGRVKIENVPPEEFLITPYARSLDCAYVAHRPTNFTRSDLLEMGVDAGIVESLPAYAPGNAEESRRRARYSDEDYGGNQDTGITGADRAQDVIGVLDEYVRCDYDGDGIAELRRVVRVDDIVILNEPVEDCPFALLCPVPMPHKVYGLSVADQAIEGQRIATAITRQTMDNLYKTNNPRPVVNELGMTLDTLEDLGDNAPGAAVRVRGPGAIDWLNVPFTAQHSIPMLELVAQNVEERTGIQRKGNGFNAEALKKNSPNTATQAAIDENSRNERAEMIARVFAETGVTRLFKLVLKLLVQHQPRERMIRLRNQWVEVDPRGWSPDMDLTISVGLGIGNKSDQIAQSRAVLEAMQQLAATPFAYLVDASKVHNALKRMFTATGIKNVDDFLVDPAQAQPPPPQPSPEMAKVQVEAQANQQKMQFQQQEAAAKLQLTQAESAARLQAMREESAAQLQLAREKAAAEIELSREKMFAEIAMQQERTAMEADLNAQRAANDHEVNLQKNRPGGDLDK